MSVKEILDTYDIAAIVRELKELEGCYLDKAYQYNKELYLKIRGKVKKDIFVRAGMWFCTTVNRPEHDDHPPAFAMTLRKYLSNSRIDSIEQYRFDRIIIIKLSKKQQYQLIFEILPKGNILLLDDKQNIIMPLFYQRWSHRVIKQGEPYLFPPSKFDMRMATFDEFVVALNEDMDVVRGLVKLGIPGIWAEEFCKKTNINKNHDITSLTTHELKYLYTTIQKQTDEIYHGKLTPEIVIKDGNAVDVTPVHLSYYESLEHHKFEIVNEAYDTYYHLKNQKDETSGTKQILKEKKDKILRRLEQQKKAIKQFEIEANNLKKKGDALFANFSFIEQVLAGDIPPKKKSYPSIIVELTFENTILDIEIDVTKNVHENAHRYYEKSKKIRDKISGAQDAIQQTVAQLNAIKITRSEPKSKSSMKTFWFENYRWFISSDGNVVVAGKDARSNERVVKKYLDNNDMYVHADIHGAPSCIVKAIDIDGVAQPISEKTLKEACIFASSYSKAWKQYTMVGAYWVNAYQVSRTPETGEFLPKGAFVIRGKRNYEKCDLKIGLGLVKLKEMKKVMAAPSSALKKHAEKWIILIPGKTEKNVIAEIAAKKFNCNVGDLQSLLPPGNAMISEEYP